MKESQWRSKLMRMRKTTNPTNFIWIMDAKFKAGFPDIYLLIDGTPVHIELKIAHFYNGYNGLDPIQLQTLKMLAAAGAVAFCFNLEDKTVGVTRINKDGSTFSKLMYNDAFYAFWQHPSALLG